MRNIKEPKKKSHKQFGWLYKVQCAQKSVKPLSAIQARFKGKRLRLCVDHVGLKYWSPILSSIADNRSLSEITVYSRSICRRIREKVNTEEKLEKLWRCGKDEFWPILYTNFLLRCLVDSIAVCARDSARITSITIDEIPLPPKYLNILCAGLKNNHRLTYLSLTKCKITDVGCKLLLESLTNNPNMRVLDLSGCCLTSKSAISMYLFLKRRRADLLQNVWTETSDRSHECYPAEKFQGLHTLILNQNPQFGDNGVRQLMYAVHYDCWLKSLGLKRCGLTKQIAEDINNVLKSNTVLAWIDLSHNRIPTNTFKAIRKLLKRREDTTESKSAKKRLFWRSGSKNEKQRLNRRTGRYHRNSLKNCPLKRFSNIQEKPKQLKEIKNTKKESALKMKKKNLRGLECQLLDIIDSNRKLMKELMNNKALVDAELQERSRTETEMQKLSLQLYDLRTRVIMVNYLQAQLNDENHILQKSFRYFFDKLTSLSILERSEIDKWKRKIFSTNQKNDKFYGPSRKIIENYRKSKIVDVVEL